VFVDAGEDPSHGTVDSPACVIPIAMAGRSMGAIAIFRTLPQKTAFSGVDHELFKLLAAQAAPALVNARLFTESGRLVPGAQAFSDQED
jgi:GAF domain-containing protein